MWWHQVYFVCFPPSLVSCLCYMWCISYIYFQKHQSSRQFQMKKKTFFETLLLINHAGYQSKKKTVKDCMWLLFNKVTCTCMKTTRMTLNLSGFYFKYWIPPVLISKWCQNYWLTDMIQHHLHQHLGVSNQAYSVQNSTGYQTCHIWTCYFSRIWVYLNISR